LSSLGWKYSVESLPGNGPSCLHGLGVVGKPMDVAIETAHPVLFRHVAQAGPAPSDTLQLGPQHFIGRTSRERNVDQGDHFCSGRAKGGVAGCIGRELRGGNVAARQWG